jgi:uridylate kinase
VNIAYRTVLLKLSGEALAPEGGSGLDPAACGRIAAQIAKLVRAGVRFGIVLGGGNILRGAAASATGLDRTVADSMGMLATAINSLLMEQCLAAQDVPAVTMCANALDKVAQLYEPRRAREYLEQGRVVLVAGGTGNPYFTTDTAAALRCAELGADVLLKATKVDGVYDSDPLTNPKAVRFDRISYTEALSRNLRVMDATAFSFCMELSIPIVVFKLAQEGNLERCIAGEPVGSLVSRGV